AVLPAHVHAPQLERRTVLGAAPRRLGREVEAALPDHLTRRVGTAVVVPAVAAHPHGPILAARARRGGTDPASGRAPGMPTTPPSDPCPPSPVDPGRPRGPHHWT